MQISGVVPILLNIILSEQQSQKKQMPVPKEQVLEKNAVKAAEVLTRGVEREAQLSPHLRSHESSEPLLLPLPLKTPLFPDTQFYVFKNYQEETRNRGEKALENGVAFSLSTHTLGSLFFYLTVKESTINIACHAENENYAAKLAAHSVELKEQVKKKGFEQVIFRCTVLDPKMKEMVANLASPLLLDKKV